MNANGAEARFHAHFEAATLRGFAPALRRPPLAAELNMGQVRAGGGAKGAHDPYVLDPGDVRPENVVVAPDGRRCVLVDFENIGVRRRSAALAAMLPNWGGVGDALVGAYARTLQKVSRYPSTAPALTQLTSSVY